ncbi:MAG: methylmalonyl Co-A mutase-associated GTPase MeaB [Bacteroidota bacterium]
MLERDLGLFSRTITLVESNSREHMLKAQEVLKGLLPYTGNSVRIGITGPPGAGKSTFIEALGTFLCDNGFKVAVLAIDPSSTKTKGSILGDKTRMEKLSREKNAFIRPSPSGGTLGGVARKTRETLLVCEAAGYDVILIETIGVGQSEITVRSMVDFFMLLLLPGSGDELQGIKKGVVELADTIVINKADGDYVKRANITKNSYIQALRLLSPATKGWQTQVYTASAETGKGIGDVWSGINDFLENTKQSGIFDRRRKEQMLEWFHSMIDDRLKAIFFENDKIKDALKSKEKEIISGDITPTLAVESLIDIFSERIK